MIAARRLSKSILVAAFLRADLSTETLPPETYVPLEVVHARDFYAAWHLAIVDLLENIDKKSILLSFVQLINTLSRHPCRVACARSRLLAHTSTRD